MFKSKKFTYTIAATIAWLFSIFFIFSTGGGGVATVHAAASAQKMYEQQNVMDDLEGSTIGGRLFNTADYPYSDDADPQIISFAEFGYSDDRDKQYDYGLFVYVYNPHGTGLDVKGNSVLFGYADQNPDKYPLELLNYSGRFYKFEVTLKEAERNAMLRILNAGARIYEVTELELSENGAITAFKVAQSYTYTGYSKGYGRDNADNTLTCEVDGFDRYAQLNVKHTVYRPQGDYYEGKQSQINSCYFSVPEDYITNYGALTDILCEWYEYVTKPMAVLTDKELYRELYALHGLTVDNFNPDKAFIILRLAALDENVLGRYGTGLIDTNIKLKDYYEFTENWAVKYNFTVKNPEATRHGNFAAVFYTENYKSEYIPASKVKDELVENSLLLGDTSICGKYSESLFMDDVDDGHMRGYNKKLVSAGEDKEFFYTLTTKSFWQTLFGGYDVETLQDSIKAIQIVESGDFKGSDNEIADRLCVYAGDVNDIKTEYATATANKEKLVLFRYGVSDYYSMPVLSSFKDNTENVDYELVKECVLNFQNKSGYNGYSAQETVYLNFDIISLWFTQDNVKTVLPVISTPTDVIGGLQWPAEEEYHNQQYKDLWKIIGIIAAILIVIVIVVLLWPVLSPLLGLLVKGVIWIIAAPFRAINKAVSKSRKKRRRAKEDNKKQTVKKTQDKPAKGSRKEDT